MARYLVVDAVNKSKFFSFYKDNWFELLFSSDKEEMECLHQLPQGNWM